MIDPQYSMENLYQLIQQNIQENTKQNNSYSGVLLLDVRTPEEYAEGHIKGSRNVSHEEVMVKAPELKPELENFNKVIIYCRSGKRSQMAHNALEAQGLSNLLCICNSGMQDWLDQGLPIE